MSIPSKSPGRSSKALFPYQHRMIDHILKHDFCALWVDMGLGKTVSVLTAIKELRRQFEARNVLVVAPLRVASMVWPEEVDEWEHLDFTVSRILGDPNARRTAIRTEADIHVINRENMEWLVDYWSVKGKLRHWPWETVVIDESSSFKNSTAKRHRALAKCMPHVTRMVQLTGTPTPNGIEDAWAQIKLLDGGDRLGRTKTAFRNRWMSYVPGSYDKKPRPGAEKEVGRLISDIVLTMRAEDYLDLPDIVENVVKVRLNDVEMEKYRQMQREYVLELEGETVTALNSGGLWGKLLQLANGAVYTEHPAWVELHRHKMDALAELHESVAGPMMIAYSYQSDKDRIAKVLTGAKAAWRFMDTEQDQADWNAGKFDRLVLHPASAGHGLNLHKSGCRDVCWFGLTPNLEHYEQLNARVAGGHRAAFSNKPIVIHKILTAGTQDTTVNALLGQKVGWQEGIMKAAKNLLEEAHRA